MDSTPKTLKELHQVREVIAGGADSGMSFKYGVILYWSGEDNTFIAGVPELPGCAADGATYAKALKNVERVIREWIETAEEEGRPIPEPKKGRLVYA